MSFNDIEGSSGRSGRWSEYVRLATSVVTALTVVAAGLQYVFGLFTSIRLEVGLPPIIEFRCSDPFSNSLLCVVGPNPHSRHMTITAALNLRAVGDPNKEATIVQATAEVWPYAASGDATKQPPTYRLTGLWSADFVPGQSFHRRQITVNSLKGGESRSQEMWFFPIENDCGAKTLDQCASIERSQFLPWRDFLAILARSDPSQPLSSTAIRVQFSFEYRDAKANAMTPVVVDCYVQMSKTLRHLADPLSYQDNEVRSISAPCREAAPQSQPKP